MIIIIDPWKTDYLTGFIESLSNSSKCQVYLFTSINFKQPSFSNNLFIKNIFFPISDKFSLPIFRKFIRGVEYIFALFYIFFFILKHKGIISVIHFQWLLFLPIDLFFIILFKKFKKKIILTAHDIIPHINGIKKIPILNKVYSNFDTIFVHGNKLKSQFHLLFPNIKVPVKVIYHGFINSNIKISKDMDLLKILSGKKINKVFLIFGFQFYNKGTDILLQIWKNNKEIHEGNLLIVAGKSINYPELIKLTETNIPNFYFKNEFIEESLLNYYLTLANIVLLPYRNASMTGQIFKVGNFKKPVLATNVGSIGEYISESCSFLVENNTSSIYKKLLEIVDIDNKLLVEIGNKMFDHLNKNFLWDIQIERILNEYK